MRSFYLITSTILVVLVLHGCNSTSRHRASMDELAIEAYCYRMMNDWRSIDRLPRENPDRDHSDFYYRMPDRPALAVDELAPHVTINEIRDVPFQPNLKQYMLTLDEEGKQIIRDWAGVDMSEVWERWLGAEYMLVVGLRNGQAYLYSI